MICTVYHSKASLNFVKYTFAELGETIHFCRSSGAQLEVSIILGSVLSH